MPPNPPATSSVQHAVDLTFPGGGLVSSNGPFTVTTGAAIIASDVGNVEAFTAGEPVYTAAGRPNGCVTENRTFKIDKNAL
jgi:hypothetical protein